MEGRTHEAGIEKHSYALKASILSLIDPAQSIDSKAILKCLLKQILQSGAKAMSATSVVQFIK